MTTDDELDAFARQLIGRLDNLLESADLVGDPIQRRRTPSNEPPDILEVLKRRRRDLRHRHAKALEQAAELERKLEDLEYQIAKHRWKIHPSRQV